MSGIINSVGARSGIVGSDVYPTGHKRFLSESAIETLSGVAADTNIITTLATGTFTAGSRIWMHFHISSVYTPLTNTLFGQGRISGEAASTGTSTDSGVGYRGAGDIVFQEFGYGWPGPLSMSGYAMAQIITPINGATSASYNIWYEELADGTFYNFLKCKMSLWEVF